MNIKATVADYDTYRVEGAIGGGNDKVAVRLSGSFNDGDGYIENRLDPGTDLNNTDDQTYRLQVLFTPSDDIELLLIARG